MKKFLSTSILGLTLAAVLASPYVVSAQVVIDPTVTDPAPVTESTGDLATGDAVVLPPPPDRRDRDDRRDRFNPHAEWDESYEWTTDSKTITRDGSRTGSEPVRATVELASSEMRSYTTYDTVTYQVPVRRCTSTAANGSSNNWNGYFNVPMSQKPQALAATIKGVGPARAEKLVALRTFDHKPRSWAEFEEMIERADDDVPGLYRDVITNFGAENRRNLGYGYTTQEDCVIIGYRTRTSYVEARRTAPTGRRHNLEFDLAIEGGALLPAESETFTVRYQNAQVWVDAPNYYNTYTVTSRDRNTRDGDASKIARGVRNRVKPPKALTLQAQRNGQRVDVVVTDRNFIQDSRLGERYALFQLKQRKTVGRDITVGTQGSATMKPDVASTKVEGTTDVNMREGTSFLSSSHVEAYVEVRVKYKNSAYYSEEPSEETESNRIDFGRRQR